jgi:hypothetical protein
MANDIIILTLLALLFSHPLICAATPPADLELLTIGGLGAMTDYPKSDFMLSLHINFLLAVKDFNERRADVLPVLGSPLMQNCARNISITHIDDSFSVTKHMFNVEKYLETVQGIVGMDSSTRATHSALLANVRDLPIVSHWVSSPVLGNKDTYPNFARTGPSDGQVASRVVALLKQLGVERVSFLYLDVRWCLGV